MFVGKMPIKDLEIDLPVSEINVQQKVESLKGNGLIQPVAVWLGPSGKKSKKSRPRIIDGFHRIEAARRLGWTEVNCNQIDCTEEAFWDARIQSAKQHADVERPRLMAWIRECWDASPWSGHRIEECIWELLKHPPNKESPMDCLLRGEDLKLYEWLASHATSWSMSTPDLQEAILGDFGLPLRWKQQEVIQKVAREHDLNIDQTQKLQNEIDRYSWLTQSRESMKPPELADHIETYLDPETRKGKDFINHVEERQRITQEDDARKARAEWLAKEAQTRSEEAAAAPRWIRRRISGAYDSLYTALHSDNDLLQQMRDGPEMLAEFAVLVRDAIAALWPSSRVELWEVPSVLEENAKLRRALYQEHQLRIQAEAALLHGKERAAKLQEKLTDVIAWPGD